MPEIATSGGATVIGNVQAGRDFVGRDQLNLYIEPVNATADTVAEIVSDARDPELQEVRITLRDLRSLVKELSKTHSTIVRRVVDPLRQIDDDPQAFGSAFKRYYAGFLRFYESKAFDKERMHCHKVQEIGLRLRRRKHSFASEESWNRLYDTLAPLYVSDMTLIDGYYKPFMRSTNEVMKAISGKIRNGEITQAIADKDAFLDSLEPGFDSVKEKLEEMTDTIGKMPGGL